MHFEPIGFIVPREELDETSAQAFVPLVPLQHSHTCIVADLTGAAGVLAALLLLLVGFRSGDCEKSELSSLQSSLSPGLRPLRSCSSRSFLLRRDFGDGIRLQPLVIVRCAKGLAVDLHTLEPKKHENITHTHTHTLQHYGLSCNSLT